MVILSKTTAVLFGTNCVKVVFAKIKKNVLFVERQVQHVATRFPSVGWEVVLWHIGILRRTDKHTQKQYMSGVLLTTDFGSLS